MTALHFYLTVLVWLAFGASLVNGLGLPLMRALGL